MNNAHPRDPSRPAAGHGGTINPPSRTVVDEFAALRLHSPGMADYASFAHNPPSTAAMVSRARHHAEEVARFVAMAQLNPENARLHLAQLYALALLNAIATIAVALIPARTGADRHARRQHGVAFVQSLEQPQDAELRDVAAIAFGLREADPVTVSNDAIAFAAPARKALPTVDRATTHLIEDHLTLYRWLSHEPDVTVLIAAAKRHGEMANRFATSLDEGELSPAERDLTMAAQEGAMLQHLLALADLALSRQEVDTDLILGAAHPEVMARAQLNAVLFIAIAAGRHHRTMVATIPY